jgi:hypothetical protein
MRSRIAVKLFGITLLCVLVAILPGQGREKPAKPGQGREKPASSATKSTQAWTFEEALEQLRHSPRDPYLQYVAFQLARREKDAAAAIEQVEATLPHLGGRGEGRESQVDLFSIFTGSLAVQESLQLDTLRASTPNAEKVSGVRTGRATPTTGYSGALETPAGPDEKVGTAAKQAPYTVTEMVPVTETAYKQVVETVTDRDGKELTVCKQVPYTVTKMVPVSRIVKPEGTTNYPPASSKDGAPAKPEKEPEPLKSEPTNPKPMPAESDTRRMSRADEEGPPEKVEPKSEPKPIGLPSAPAPAPLYVPPAPPAVPLPAPSVAPVPPPPTDAQEQDDKKAREAAEKRKTEIVDVARLEGPEVKSHPWKKMLAGKKPELSPLAKFVPVDCYFVEFHSLGKMLEAMDLVDQWGTHLANQAIREARTQRIGDRLREQLVLEVDPKLRPFYDLAVEDVAVTGSDLFLREGSDVTLLFRMKQPAIFKQRVDGFLANAKKENQDAKRTTGTYMGVEYVHLSTPDHRLNVYSAYPQDDLHVRSNSLIGFLRIVEAIQGKHPNGKPVVRLADTDEFAYIRTLMPRGAAEEDGFIYLSDPFIRKQVSAKVKLTERHRMQCYNHLRMIGHGSMMYRTEYGKAPASLAELAKSGCAPGLFGEGPLTCPDGGTYGLSADGLFGTCSHHGHAHGLTPCCENYVKHVTGTEADEYLNFVQDYNEYWKTYFDPIALRIQITPQRYRIETIILPLIDNSIYSGLATAFGGAPEPLDALPVPKKNIFTLSLRLNKEKLLKEMDENLAKADEFISTADLSRVTGLTRKDLNRISMKSFRKFLDKGLGNQIAVHVYDAVPIVDVNLASMWGTLLSSGRSSQETELAMVGLGAIAASLSAPVYISIPVKDAKIVDDFLESLDPLFTNRFAAQGFEQDFYFLRKDKELTLRGNVLRFGPVKVRFFTGRIGDAFYIVICNKPFILDDLVALDAAVKGGTVQKGDSGPVGHAMMRMRAENWNQVMSDLNLGWAENNRVGCLDNLGLLSNVSRSMTASSNGKPPSADEVLRMADRLHDVHFFCPEGGHYQVSPDGKKCTCSVHGWYREPRQQEAPLPDSPSAKLMREFAGMSATLTFRKDGLQAVLVIDRK